MASIGRGLSLSPGGGDLLTRDELLVTPESRAALEAWERGDGFAFETFERGTN